MNVARIRGFLLQLPKPAIVRVTTGDGEPQELKPGKSYAKCAESIAALGADLVECVDTAGKLLRAMRTQSGDAQRSDAAAVPAGIQTDPHALMLTHFANLLHRAYEHSTEISFTKLLELVERLGDRAESIEQRLERTEAANRRLVNEQIHSAFERADEAAEAAGAGGNDELLQQMATAFFSGGMQAKQPKTANGKGHE